MKKTATIILTRNLPDVTDQLVAHLVDMSGDVTDIYVLEAGSDECLLSSSCTWWINDEEIVKNGLRPPRGFNLALLKLLEENKFYNYEYFFLIPNDIEFGNDPIVQTLEQEMDTHPKVGILSPCSNKWGERKLIGENSTKYFWYIGLNYWFVRREFVEELMQKDKTKYINFLFDGNNFRGYQADTELIAKGYVNDWASAITTKLIAEENEAYLLRKADLIKTDSYHENMQKYLAEGKDWMKSKYGFNSKWDMQMYA
jgi:hypothetical protein